MNSSKRRAHVIATIALCAVVVALAIGVIAQQLAASRLSRGIEQQKQLLAKSRQDLKDRAKWRSDYSDLSLKLGGRMSTCSWSDQMPFMMAQVTGIVEANGMKVESLQPEPMTSSGSIQRFPMRLTLQTDLKRLTEVLKDFRNAMPLVDVERLEVRNAQGENGKLQVNMTVASFVVIDKNSPTAKRRAAVIPVKGKDKTKEPDEVAKSETKPEAKTDSKSVKPAVEQPGKPAAKPSREAVPDRREQREARPERSESRRESAGRSESPRNGSSARSSGAGRPESTGGRIAVPDVNGKSGPRAIEARPEGGSR